MSLSIICENDWAEWIQDLCWENLQETRWSAPQIVQMIPFPGEWKPTGVVVRLQPDCYLLFLKLACPTGLGRRGSHPTGGRGVPQRIRRDQMKAYPYGLSTRSFRTTRSERSDRR